MQPRLVATSVILSLTACDRCHEKPASPGASSIASSQPASTTATGAASQPAQPNAQAASTESCPQVELFVPADLELGEEDTVKGADLFRAAWPNTAALGATCCAGDDVVRAGLSQQTICTIEGGKLGSKTVWMMEIEYRSRVCEGGERVVKSAGTKVAAFSVAQDGTPALVDITNDTIEIYDHEDAESDLDKGHRRGDVGVSYAPIASNASALQITRKEEGAGYEWGASSTKTMLHCLRDGVWHLVYDVQEQADSWSDAGEDRERCEWEFTAKKKAGAFTIKEHCTTEDRSNSGPQDEAAPTDKTRALSFNGDSYR